MVSGSAALATHRAEQKAVLLSEDAAWRVSPVEFDSFYRQHAEAVYRALCVRLGDTDLAQDAAAEGLARAFQHWPSIRRYQSPAGWAYRAGLNWATSRLRRRRRERQRARDDARSSTAGLVDAEAVGPDLEQALQSLGEAQREVVVLRYVLDLHQHEIADLLEVPVGTVKSRLGRGLAQLREVMGHG